MEKRQLGRGNMQQPTSTWKRPNIVKWQIRRRWNIYGTY